MPELPEVETVRRGLEKIILHKTIVKARAYRPDLRVPFPKDLSGKLNGRTITAVARRAKYVLIHLNNGQTLVLHLGMSGRVTTGKKLTSGPHDHMEIVLSDGTQVLLNDPRRFGMVLLLRNNELKTHPAFAGLGPEPLGNEFSAPALREKLKGRKASIKQMLLDQRVVSGVGNIYACEALYKAGISPIRAAGRIGPEKAEKLVVAIRQVLTNAIAAGGSSLRDYRQVDGELGYFQHSWSVYGKEGDKCPACDCDSARTNGIKRITQSGRSTFYCPRKQT